MNDVVDALDLTDLLVAVILSLDFLIHGTDEDLPPSSWNYFRGQFDVQLFTNLYFIEKNGRGDIATGKCKLMRP